VGELWIYMRLPRSDVQGASPLWHSPLEKYLWEHAIACNPQIEVQEENGLATKLRARRCLLATMLGLDCLPTSERDLVLSNVMYDVLEKVVMQM
jgi:hypothetical protein